MAPWLWNVGKIITILSAEKRIAIRLAIFTFPYRMQRLLSSNRTSRTETEHERSIKKKNLQEEIYTVCERFSICPEFKLF